MDEKLRARLRRLGVVKGARQLKPAVPHPHPSASTLPQKPGAGIRFPESQVVQNDAGQCLVADYVVPASSLHGAYSLVNVLEADPAHLNSIGSNRFTGTFRDYLFLDTETTGLSGAGALAFMVGVGFFERNAFVVRQWFVRDPSEEAAMLTELNALLTRFSQIITFNGRTFDVPLLDGRFLMNRMMSDLIDRPNLDLLIPARRLWRRRLGGCSLGALETQLLGVERTHEDVPGWMIPSLYQAYVRNPESDHTVSTMGGVFYHNRLDILSMVTLAERMIAVVTDSVEWPHALDLVSLARWQAKQGDIKSAEATLRAVAARDLSLDEWRMTMTDLSALLKRAGRRAEAAVIWQQLASTALDNVDAHIELAMHYEWHAVELERARMWSQQALSMIRPNDWSQQGELTHRISRLERKLAVHSAKSS